MRTKFAAGSVLAALAAVGVSGTAQDRPARAVRIGVLDLKACFDKDKSAAVKDIDVELQRIADDIARRMKEVEPKERERMRADYLDFYNRKKAGLFNEIVAATEAVRQEQGLTVILRADPGTLAVDDKDSPSKDVTLEIRQRAVLCHEPEIAVTEAVLKRLNEEHARKKKAGKKDF